MGMSIIEQGPRNHIKQVTVFSRQAYVTRAVEVEAEAGMQRFAVEVTAFQVDADSIQARVFGAGEILAVQYQSIPTTQIAQQEIRELDARERELGREKTRLEAGLGGNRRLQKFLDAVAGFAAVEVPREIQTAMPGVESLQDLLGYLERNGDSLARHEQEIQDKLADLDKELAAVQSRLKQLKKDKQQTRKVVEVLFQSAQSQTLSMEVSYVAGRAMWQPVYKVDVAADLGALSLTLFARIHQTTGEDWDNAECSVSTAVPLKTGSLPEVYPWYLREATAQLMDMEMGGMLEEEEAIPAGGTESRSAAPLAAAAAPPPEAHFAQAEARDKGLHFEYSLPNPVSLASGARESLLPLRAYTPQGEFFHYAAPYLEQQVYLVCRITPDAELPPGRLNVHMGGHYIGSTALEEKRAGQEMSVNLGVDRGVRCELEELVNRKSETFFGKVERSNIAREIQHRITLENLKAEAIRVQVLAAVPVSDTDRYQVKGVDLSPAPDEKDWQEREGVMCWQLGLDSGKQRRIDLRYSVKYPRDNPPWGIV